MLTVHYLNNSRAHRLLWLLEELGLDYEIKLYERGPDMRAPKSLKAVHPLGKSPVLEDNGTIVAESGAIFEYVLEKYGNGRLEPAAATPERRRYAYWMHYAEGSAMPLLVMKLIFMKLPEQVPLFLKPFARIISAGAATKLIDPQLRDHVALWEAELQRDGWFAGPEFSAADIMMSFPVQAAARRAGGGSTPAIRKYLEAVAARDASRRAAARVPQQTIPG